MKFSRIIIFTITIALTLELNKKKHLKKQNPEHEAIKEEMKCWIGKKYKNQFKKV